MVKLMMIGNNIYLCNMEMTNECLQELIDSANTVLVETPNTIVGYSGDTYKIMKNSWGIIANNIPPISDLTIRTVIDDIGLLILKRK